MSLAGKDLPVAVRPNKHVKKRRGNDDAVRLEINGEKVLSLERACPLFTFCVQSHHRKNPWSIAKEGLGAHVGKVRLHKNLRAEVSVVEGTIRSTASL